MIWLFACIPALVGSGPDGDGPVDSAPPEDSGRSHVDTNPPVNLLSNPSFEDADGDWSEDGTPAWWARWGDGTDRWVHGEASYDGARFVALGGDPYALLFQRLEAQPGQTFEVGTWARAGADTSATVKVEFHTSDATGLVEHVEVFDVTQSWEFYTVQGTAPEGTGLVTATIGGADEETWFDAVWLFEID